jgi:hypothetical protein
LNASLECGTRGWVPKHIPFVLVVEVEFAINTKLEILYGGVYQRDETIVLMWFAKLSLIHFDGYVVHYSKFQLIMK